MKRKISDQALAARARERLYDLADNAAMPRPIVRFDLRGRTAGQAHYETLTVRLNMELFSAQPDAFMARTVVHEWCHLEAFHRYGRSIKPHGREWRNLMIGYGADPSRCHDYDVSRTTTQRLFDYTCNCRTHLVTATIHNKIKGGQRRRCALCRSRLVASAKTLFDVAAHTPSRKVKT